MMAAMPLSVWPFLEENGAHLGHGASGARRCGQAVDRPWAESPSSLHRDPPPLNWSTLMYVFGQRGRTIECRESATSRDCCACAVLRSTNADAVVSVDAPSGAFR